MIDRGLPDPWPEAVRDAASRFEQGDLVRDPPFFYWANTAHPVWDVTVDVAARGEQDPLIALDPGDGPPLGIITTQTCDLDEAVPKKPWFHVAPVVGADAFPDEDLASIRAQKYGYLHALPPHDHPLPSGAPCSLLGSDPQGGGDGAASEDPDRLHADVPHAG